MEGDPTYQATLVPLPFVDPENTALDVVRRTYLTETYNGSTNTPNGAGFKIEVVPAFTPTIDPAATDVNMYKEVEYSIKPAFAKVVNFRDLRGAVNPYEELGKGPFMNRAALKLANIDAIYKFTGQLNGMNDPIVRDTLFRYAAIADGPGGFVQYLQFRVPGSRGSGITWKSDTPEFDWDTRNIRMDTFFPFEGTTPGNPGDIFAQWEQYTKYVMDTTIVGVDLCTGDAGIEMEGNEQLQESANFRLLLVQSLIALLVVKKKERAENAFDPAHPEDGGSFILKVYNTSHPVTLQLIYVLSCCFENISMFKPVSSRPANSERYLVCMKCRYREDILPWIEALKAVANVYTGSTAGGSTSNSGNISQSGSTPGGNTAGGGTGGGFVQSFLTRRSPRFYEWMKKQNDANFRRQRLFGIRILQLAGLVQPRISLEEARGPKVDLAKTLIVWNLPDSRIEFVKQEGACSRGRGGRSRGRGTGRGRGRGRSAGFS